RQGPLVGEAIAAVAGDGVAGELVGPADVGPRVIEGDDDVGACQHDRCLTLRIVPGSIGGDVVDQDVGIGGQQGPIFEPLDDQWPAAQPLYGMTTDQLSAWRAQTPS